jgi:hypothetical protein
MRHAIITTAYRKLCTAAFVNKRQGDIEQISDDAISIVDDMHGGMSSNG